MSRRCPSRTGGPAFDHPSRLGPLISLAATDKVGAHPFALFAKGWERQTLAARLFDHAAGAAKAQSECNLARRTPLPKTGEGWGTRGRRTIGDSEGATAPERVLSSPAQDSELINVLLKSYFTE